MTLKKNAAATPPQFSTTYLRDKYIKLIEFLFCDTTNGKAVCTMDDIGRAYDAPIDVEAVSIAATLCTTPVDAEVTTVAERAIGVVAAASSRQGQ
jgi:hypothetical protein